MKTFKLTTGFMLMIAALLTWNTSRADQYGPSYNEFAQKIRIAQDPCRNDLSCVFSERSGLSMQVMYDITTNPSPLAPALLAKLNEVASDQANIWADTILEGDYVADGKTRLDRIEAVYQGAEMVAYRITYSERAWYVGECDYDYQNHSKLDQCQEGRISESTFVTSDLSSWLRDELAYAEFRE